MSWQDGCWADHNGVGLGYIMSILMTTATTTTRETHQLEQCSVA